MTEVSKIWTMADATAGFQGTVAAMAKGGFDLVAAGALLYVRGVYWETPRIKADDITATIHGLCEGLNYGKSSKYQLASAAMKVARNLTRKWGQPDAAKDRNVAWVMLHDAETFLDAVTLLVAEIKAAYQVETLQALYLALAGAKAETAKERKSPSERFLKILAKDQEDGVLQAGEVEAAIMAMVNQYLTPDRVAAMLPMLTAKVTAAANPSQDVQDVIEQSKAA